MKEKIDDVKDNEIKYMYVCMYIYIFAMASFYC
jgi:hypothetical protein